MKSGFVMPFGDARTAADLARLAEQASWDGFFVWEPVWGNDAWVCLTAAAMTTERIRLGTLLTPISRLRPWKFASETATLDRLSNARVILAVGLGAVDTGFSEFGEVTERKTRVELMDEGLDILTGLWAGQPFHYKGKHYTIRPTEFQPPPAPVQQPRIPIWVVGAWPSEKSMARAARYDGLLPQVVKPGPGGARTAQQASPDDVRQMKAYMQARHDPETSYDIILDGETPGDQPEKALELTQPWVEAGATWWIESRWGIPHDAEGLNLVRRRIEQGPPGND
jgi:alkanesulfonate monooxygenase SsuD/methylene tetrahydromethanopterin reductase-like flavin-dependent oxidoreductase (luciferase family)